MCNIVDYQNKQMTTTEQEFFDEKDAFHREEFKRILDREDSDDSDGGGKITLG